MQNKLIVRYHNGTTLYIMPDLPNKLKEAVRNIKAGSSLTDLIKQVNDQSGLRVPPENTWYQLIQEVLDVFEQPLEGKVDRKKAVLCVLEAICSNEKDAEIWRVAKEEIFKHIDILSGWSYGYFRRSHQTEPVVKKEGKYYTYLNGQICEIIGERTEKEERWSYVADCCSSAYGSINSLFKLTALANICLDFQSNFRQYPANMIIVLPENGGSSFLHWKWHIKWPYCPKIINWRPYNNLCDPDWLASDFLSYFSEQEGIPEEELEPAEWKGPEVKWREEFEKYPGQLEFALDTHLRFGYEEEIWFDFRGKKLRWINQTENRYTVMIVPVSNRDSYNKEYELAMRFLSYLAFNTGVPISVLTSVECQTRFHPMLHQPKIKGEIVYPFDYNNYIKHPKSFSNKQDLAYAFYKEGLSSSSVYYSFLSFYKIIQLAFDEDRKKITDWINNSFDKIRYPGTLERIKEIKNKEGNIAEYLFNLGRCAIAHVRKYKKGLVADPDNPEDIDRLMKDLSIVKGLARYAIESGIFNLSEKEIKSYE